MPILAISSHVAVGHVGNAAAVPAMERLGHTVWRVDTVSLSNHPGHGAFTGSFRSPGELESLLQGIESHTGWQNLDGIYTGYMGDAGNPEMIAGFLKAARTAKPDHLYLLDPVMGDHGKSFVKEGVEEAIKNQLLPLANIITPNLYELSRLSGKPVETLDQMVEAAQSLLSHHLRSIVVTGIEEQETIASLLVEAEAAFVARVPKLDRNFFGTGDLLAGLLLSHFLKKGDSVEALSKSLAALDHATNTTVAAGKIDLALIPALARIDQLHPIGIERL